MKVAHVSTFPQIKCGIAFYVSDLLQALPNGQHAKFALHYGENCTTDSVYDADVSQQEQLENMALCISRSNFDVVSIQHEFGIWGGDEGEHIYSFLDKINKPIVSTLHTTFRKFSRPLSQECMLKDLVRRSVQSIVLTPESKATLCSALKIPTSLVTVIPHGIPDIGFRSVPDFSSDGNPHIWKFCSIGFFRPDKGIEEILHALSLLDHAGYQFEYVIAGAPQPQFSQQREYLQETINLIAELGLEERVYIEDRFLSREEQIQLIQDSHVALFAYQDPDQSSSGAIPLVLGTGRPVVCTPFEYALSKQRELGQIMRVAKSFDASAFGEEIVRFFQLKSDYLQCCSEIYERTRCWTWANVALKYAIAFENAATKADT